MQERASVRVQGQVRAYLPHPVHHLKTLRSYHLSYGGPLGLRRRSLRLPQSPASEQHYSEHQPARRTLYASLRPQFHVHLPITPMVPSAGARKEWDSYDPPDISGAGETNA